MPSLIVVGTQWGDEGKGKVVDWLAQEADVVVRFQGGNNAGHTLNIAGKESRLSLLPCGVTRRRCLNVIGPGVVVDLEALSEEMAAMRAQGFGISPENLLLSDRACLLLPLHRWLDRRQERERGKALGTTARGIGPAYEERVGRRALRLGDIGAPEYLRHRYHELLTYHERRSAADKLEIARLREGITDLVLLAQRFKPYIGECGVALEQRGRAGAKILYEGAQGTFLDITHGTYPYVTSSSTLASEAASGSGYGAARRAPALGVVKAYTTRVGAGPFPSEDSGTVAAKLRQAGQEFGTVTGRPRRCGWFDAVLLRTAVRLCDIDALALTKIDVLDEFDTIELVIGYHLDGEKIDHLPATLDAQERLTVETETWPGWRKEKCRGVRRFDDLPLHAQRLCRRIEQLCAVPIALISTAQYREDMIMLRDPFSF